MRGKAWWVGVCAFGLAVAGCGPQKPSGPAGPTAPGGPAGAPSLTVGLVTDAGGIDDQSFNASSWAGVKKAETDLGVKGKYVESREQADYEPNLSTMADQGNKLVFAVGFLMTDAMKVVCPKYPNTKFAIIDGESSGTPNCVALKFREEEGSFLAGYLAARMSKTGAIGFVGGMESPLIKKFEVGYYAGARTANPTVRMIPKYVGNWVDVGKGKELAEAIFREGADIVFAAAGKGGLGALDAAAQKGPGYYGIGVDADQDHIHPGRILTSMVKRVDVAVFQTIQALKDNQWQSGERVFGIKEGGIGLSPMKYTKQDVPPDVLAKLDTLSKMIADGKLQVPSTDEGMQNFVAPKL